MKKPESRAVKAGRAFQRSLALIIIIGIVMLPGVYYGQKYLNSPGAAALRSHNLAAEPRQNSGTSVPAMNTPAAPAEIPASPSPRPLHLPRCRVVTCLPPADESSGTNTATEASPSNSMPRPDLSGDDSASNQMPRPAVDSSSYRQQCQQQQQFNAPAECGIGPDIKEEELCFGKPFL